MSRAAVPWRLAAVLVAASIGVAACSDSGSTDSSGETSSGDTSTSEASPAVEPVVDVGSTPDEAVLRSPVIPVGETLVALASPKDGSPLDLRPVRAAGPAEPWESIDLPDAPGAGTVDTHDSWSLDRHGSAAVLSTSRADQDSVTLRVWSSDDGVEWQGGVVGTYDGAAVTAHPHADGIMAVAAQDGAVVIVTGAAAGGPWQTTPLPALTLRENEFVDLAGSPWSMPDGGVRASISFYGATDRSGLHVLVDAPSLSGPWSVVDDACAGSGQAPRGECRPVLTAGDVLARGLEVSGDGGATWELAEFAPALVVSPYAEVHGFTAVEPLPDGGFVGTMTGFIPAGGGSLAWVVHSDDGRSWQPLLGPGIDGCDDNPQDTAQPWASAEIPVVVDDGAMVVHNCPGVDPGVFHIPAGGAAATLVEQVSGPQLRLGAPFAFAGHVVTPVVQADSGEVVRFVVVDRVAG